MHPTARRLIRELGLQPHPEGGYFREVHRAAERVATAKGRRAALTTIYFLLARGQRSVFHRVTSDEVWHYYGGDPLRLWRVPKDFSAREEIRLGPVGKKTAPVAVIKRGEWQAAESLGDYTLVGCSVGPGFDFRDFRLLRDDAVGPGKLRKAHPGLADFI